jgi:Uncharacterized protein conserved in bacteria (DUF2330)
MRTRPLRAVIFVIGLLIPTGVVLGDGSMFVRWNNDADILQPTQKVYIHTNGVQERLVIQTKYTGPAEELVWLIPVPAQPTVERGDPNLFEELSKETRRLDISQTDFVGLRFYSVSGGRDRDPVEWRQRIGDYDVVLLAPVGGENVIEWLNANEFGVPDEAVPILLDYIANEWWMVAARIHPDALTEITREALAEGTLHPLDMTFPSAACVYPLRLTSLAAGPVEELIYIEGPSHYQPATLAHGDWDIRVFGGTKRTLPDEYAHSAIDQALEILAGEVVTSQVRYLTKLRRVFGPEEMTDDLIFEKMSYEKLITSDNPNRIGQAATQIGRHRDPAGIPSLLAAIAPEALEQAVPAPEHYAQWLGPSARILSREGLHEHPAVCRHLRSCIWALGEIAIEQKPAPEIEVPLLRCARHDSQLIRMEAYAALTKLRAETLGPILTERLSEVLDSFPTPLVYADWFEVLIAIGELDMVLDWVERFGSAQENEAVVKTLADMIARLPGGPNDLDDPGGPQPAYDWLAWTVWRAGRSQNGQLVAPLQELRARLAPETSEVVYECALGAEAACGSSEAVALLAQRLVQEQSELIVDASDGYAYRPSWGSRDKYDYNLRNWMFWQSAPPFPYRNVDFYSITPPAVLGTVARAALETEGLSDWGILYLLGHISDPQAGDKNRLMELWDRNTGPIHVVAVDVLYVWGDSDTLLQLHDQTDEPEVQDEIAWVLGELGIWEPVEKPEQ